MYSCHVDLRSGGYPTVNASAEVVVYGMINKSYFLYLPNINNFAYDYLLSLLTKNMIFVIEKPTFITELKRETLSDYGSTVTLSCDAVGVPPPKISWFFNTEPINHLLGSR